MNRLLVILIVLGSIIVLFGCTKPDANVKDNNCLSLDSNDLNCLTSSGGGGIVTPIVDIPGNATTNVDVVTQAFNILVEKGRNATFTAEYFRDGCPVDLKPSCATNSEAKAGFDKTYFREYYAGGKNRVDNFDISSTYLISDPKNPRSQYVASFYLLDNNFVCNAVNDLVNNFYQKTGTYKCETLFPLDAWAASTVEADLVAETVYDNNPVLKIIQLSNKIIIGEDATCFNVTIARAVSKDYCFSSDGILLEMKDYTQYSTSEIIVTKIERTTKANDFETLEGKTF